MKTLSDEYSAYLDTPVEPFLSEFVTFSIENRKKFNVLKEKEFWPLEQLYNLLKRCTGGFILDIGQHACLGVAVKKVPAEEGWFEVTYRDPYHAELQKIQINSKNLQTKNDKKIKIQWFGFFTFLGERGEQPGFTSLTKYNYKLQLPKEHKKLIQKDLFLCGDITAYLAMKSTIRFQATKSKSKN